MQGPQRTADAGNEVELVIFTCLYRQVEIAMRQVLLAGLATFAALAAVVSLAAAAGAPDRYCLQGPQWEYPGKCQFTSYFHCMTKGGKDAKCRENPKYEYGRKRPTSGR